MGPDANAFVALPQRAAGTTWGSLGRGRTLADVKAPKRIRLVRLSPAVMQALVDGDLEQASEQAGVPLTPFTVDESWLWKIRLADFAKRPEAVDWVARAAVDEETGQVVGHGGFHGPPDERGMVELAYTTDPAFRRQGYATAMLEALLEWAADVPDVDVVRASIRPDNAASLATLAGHGFAQVGDQWDEEDGLELLFERPAR